MHFRSDKRLGSLAESALKVRIHWMKKHPASIPSSKEIRHLEAQLKATPGLAQGFIEAMQDEHDKQVKSGKLPPEKALKLKKMMKQLQAELTGFTVRQALVKMGWRLVKMQEKERLTKRDLEALRAFMKEIPQLEKQLKGTLKDERGELTLFLHDAGSEICLQYERILVQKHGMAKARELFPAPQLPSESFRVKRPVKRKPQAARPTTSRTSAVPGSPGRKRAVKASRRA